MIELGHIPAGNYVESNQAVYWNGRSENGEQVSSGTYFYQIEAGDYTETRKMVFLKYLDHVGKYDSVNCLKPLN